MQPVITNIDFTKKITVTNTLSFLLFERVIVVSIIDLSSIFIEALSLPPILHSSLLPSPKNINRDRR
jgi:hypothetical protein